MSVTSFLFLFFIVSVIFVYFICPSRYRWLVLLAANIFFYCTYGVSYIMYMIVSSLIVFLAALYMNKTSLHYKNEIASAEKEQKKQLKEELKKKKKRIRLIAVLIVSGIWIVLKYTNFIISNVNLFLSGNTIPSVSWIMPLGISFYSFVLLGYLIDVYRDKYEAEKNYLRFFSFVSYFPHIIQGPFSRYDDLGKQLKEEHRFSYDRLIEGCSRILWGFFKKLVVADKAAIVVDAIQTSYTEYTTIYLLFAIVMYSIQLYADFTAYMDIMGGISHILGIELAVNFKQPYLAETVDDFWRRWHITLGEWFRDYVFYPLSMSSMAYKIANYARSHWSNKAAKLLPSYIALFVVWTATGLWHEASWKQVIWGYMNMIVIIYSMQTNDFNQKLRQYLHIDQESVIWKLFCIVRTFLLISFFRIFSGSESIATAISYVKAIVTGDLFVSVRFFDLFVTLKTSEIIAVISGTIMIMIVDILNEKELWQSATQKCPMIVRNGILAVLILSIILFAGGDNDLLGGFMYARF